jgi:hypothetical protein
MSEMMRWESRCRDVNFAGTFREVPLGLSSVETGDRYGLRGWSVNQIPIIEQLVDDLSSSMNLQGTEPFDCVEILHVQRSQAGGVQVGVQDSVTFT